MVPHSHNRPSTNPTRNARSLLIPTMTPNSRPTRLGRTGVLFSRAVATRQPPSRTTHSARCSVWAVATLALLLSGPSSAQTLPTSPVIVANLTRAASGTPRVVVVDSVTFNEALISPVATTPLGPVPPVPLATPLERLVDACDERQSALLTGDTAALVSRLANCMDCLAAYQERRFNTSPGDIVIAIVLHDINTRPRPSFVERARRSELLAATNALLPLALPEAGRGRRLACTSFVHILAHRRSYLTVNVASGGTGRDAAPVVPQVASPEITLGSEERWFLSLDVTMPRVAWGQQPSQPDETTLAHRDFFIGLNYALGDLLVDRAASLQRRSIWDEFLLKLQLAPSRTPWTSWAAGIGFRSSRVQNVLWDMELVHPYVVVGRHAGTGSKAAWRVVVGLGWDPRQLVRD